jgi:hypothetical protein
LEGAKFDVFNEMFLEMKKIEKETFWRVLNFTGREGAFGTPL